MHFCPTKQKLPAATTETIKANASVTLTHPTADDRRKEKIHLKLSSGNHPNNEEEELTTWAGTAHKHTHPSLIHANKQTKKKVAREHCKLCRMRHL